MATSTSFKQQCPSCEAMVPIRDPGLIGRKIDCPKCKYRFVVEEPVEEDEDGKPKKGAKKGPRRGEEDDAKKAGSGKMVFLGVGLAGIALVAIIVCVAVMWPSDTPKPNTGGQTSAGSGTTNNDPTPAPPQEEVKAALPNITNLLPNDTQVVVSYPMDKTLGSSLGHAALKAGGCYSSESFRQRLGFSVDEISHLITAISVDNNWVFSILQTKTPYKQEIMKAQLRLEPFPEKIASKKTTGKTYEMFVINRELDSLGNLLLKANQVRNPFAVYFLDKQTIVFADPLALKSFLQDDASPANLTDPPVAGAAPPADSNPGAAGPGGGGPPGGGPGGGFPGAPAGAGAGMGGPGAAGGPGMGPGGPGMGPGGPGMGPGGPGRGMGGPGAGDAVNPPAPVASGSYLTVPKDLKSVLDKIEKIEENKRTKNKEPASVVSIAAILNAVKGPLTKLIQDKVDSLSLPVAQKLIAQLTIQAQVAAFFRNNTAAGIGISAFDQNNLNLTVATKSGTSKTADSEEGNYRKLLPSLLTAFKDPNLDLLVTLNNAAPAGGRGPGFPGGPGMGGPGFPGGSGMGGPKGGPGGGGFPNPGGGGANRGGGFPNPGGAGNPGGGFPNPGGGGFNPGGGPGGPGGFPGGRPGGADAEKSDGTVTLTRDDTVVFASLELTLTPKAYSFISPFVYMELMQLKSESELATTRLRFYDLAAAMQLYVKETGSFPPGAMPRAETPSRGLPWRPDQRLSWVAALLPYFGPEYKEWRIDQNAAWDEGNDNPTIATFLVPYVLYSRAPEAGPSHIGYPGKSGMKFGASHFVAISGVGMDSPEYVTGNPATDRKRGIFGFNRVTRREEVKDGLDKTIALILVRGEHKAPWLAGGGATVRGVSDDDDDARPIAPFVCATWPGKPGANPKFDGRRGTIAVMADSKVRFIPENIPAATFRALCTIAGGEQIAKLDEICPVIVNEDERDLKTDDDAPPGLRVPDSVKKDPDFEKLQGVWVPTSVSQDGINLPVGALKNARVTFSGSTTTLTGLGPDQRATFTIDSTKSPKYIDSTDIDGPNKGKTQLGIYELSGKQLKICSAHDEKGARPTSFTSTVDNKQIVIILEQASGPAPSTKAEWKEFTPASKAFTAKMPGEVVEKEQNIALPGGVKIKLSIFIATASSKMFTITYSDYPAGSVAAAGKDKIMAGAKNGVLGNLPPGSKITSETAVKVGTHSGVEWVVTIPGQGTVNTRFFLIGDRAFQISVLPVSSREDPDAKTFFESFKLGT